MQNQTPLNNFKILVTRAKQAKDELVSSLESYGAIVFYCPTIEIVEPESYELLDKALSTLTKYDWVIFTSRNAVEAFLARLEKAGKSINEFENIKVLAVGSATAKSLEKANIKVSLVPEKFNAEGALASLQNYYPNKELLAKCHFLFPRAAVGRDILPVELEKLGAKVDLITAYQTRTPLGAKDELLNIFANNQIDLVTFTSPSTIINLSELVAPELLTNLLKNTAIACIGPVSAKAAEDFGLKVAVCPTQSTALSFAQAIKDFLSN